MTNRKVRSTAEALVDGLVAEGVDTVFGIPGAHMYEFTDALQRAGDRIRTIHSRHEQGSAYMAYGYARSTGRPGVFTVVPGPGVLNAGAALCTAYAANAPVLCVTGNIMSHLIGQGRGQLHELPDQLQTLRGLTKWSARINHPGEAPAALAEAFWRMKSGRPGPVALEVPWDVLPMKAPVADVALPPPLRPMVDGSAVERAAKLVDAAKRPMIFVGAGAYEAGAEVAALARRIGAPVVAHRSGKGVVPEDDPSVLNLVAAYDYWRGCDLLIGIGSRLELPFMRWRWAPPGLKTVRIDIDPTEMVRLKPSAGIVADAAEGTAALTAAVKGDADAARREPDFAAARDRARQAAASVQPQVAYLEAIRAVLPRDGFLVEEISQVGFTARFAFPVYGPRRYITSAYQENLGFGVNTALGVKVANPDNAVVSITGDGGFMFGVQELATAAQHRIAVVTVVFDNGSFGNVLRDQEQSFGGRIIGAELANPDFVRLAESFGVAAFRADSPGALRTTLDRALAAGQPAVIAVEVPRGSEASPWPFLHPAPYG